MKKIYNFVPMCPNCASRRTGHYVREPFRYKDYMMLGTLKSGEVIEFRKKEPVKNAFCMECGHEWATNIPVRYLTDEEIEMERAIRGTDELYKKYVEDNHINLNKKPILGGFLSGIFDF